jgi:glycine/D-amino acid oxidase-like deaminating enzyme
VFVIGGMHGEGFKIAPFVGRVMAEWIAKGKLPNGVDLTPFTLTRFASSKL